MSQLHNGSREARGWTSAEVSGQAAGVAMTLR